MTDAALRAAGWGAAARQPLAGDASARRYERLTRPDGARAILMILPAGEGPGAFARIARHLTARGLSAPAILAETEEGLLLEDLGDELFARRIAAAPAEEAALYAAAVDLLPRLQAAPAPAGLERLDPARLGEMTAPGRVASDPGL